MKDKMTSVMRGPRVVPKEKVQVRVCLGVVVKVRDQGQGRGRMG